MAECKFGTFDDLLDIAGDELSPIVQELRRVIFGIDPKACEVVRLGDKAATYGVGPKKMSEGYCYILPYKSWVNLGFYQGAHLTDSDGLLEGTGKNLRHFKVRSLAQIDNSSIKELIRASLNERREALGLKT